MIQLISLILKEGKPMKYLMAIPVLFMSLMCGAQINNQLFSGRYLFFSENHTNNAALPFVEGGVLTSNGQGSFQIFTTYNQGTSLPIISPNSGMAGSYTIAANGFGTISVNSGAGSFWIAPEHFFCQLSGDYCVATSSESGRSWGAKFWRDKSPGPVITTLSGCYIFQSDGALNQFSESGVMCFSGNGTYTLASIYNVALDPAHSNLTNPTPFTCGVISPMSYYGQGAIFEATQGLCPSTVGFDTFAIYCMMDGSMCVLVPDQNEAGGWIAEMRKQ